MENHKKLFNADYYKFLEIESMDEHPSLQQFEAEERKIEEVSRED